VYYSLDGNTRFVAQEMAAKLQAELLELEPRENVSRKEPVKHLQGIKQSFVKGAPELVEPGIDLRDYALLLIGTPVWSFNFSPPVRSFLKEYNPEGHRVILFCTHRGFPGMTLRNLKLELQQSNEIIGTIDFRNPLKNPESTRERINKFISSSGDIQ